MALFRKKENKLEVQEVQEPVLPVKEVKKETKGWQLGKLPVTFTYGLVNEDSDQEIVGNTDIETIMLSMAEIHNKLDKLLKFVEE